MSNEQLPQTADTKILDVLIVGGGPAGLTAAVTLARQVHTAVVFDSQSYRNGRAQHIHMVPSWDHKSPDEFRAASRQDLVKYKELELVETEITSIEKKDTLFQATDSRGRQWLGRKVLLAHGVDDIFPELEGYDECWARGIWHCLFCHGYEEKHQPSSGVLALQLIASEKFALHMAHMAARLTDTVTIYTHGNEELGRAIMEKSATDVPWKIDSRPIRRLALQHPNKPAVVIRFEDGSEVVESFLAHAPRTHVKGRFFEQLGLILTPTGDYEVTPPFCETTAAGVFAAGDCTSMFKVAMNAIATGSITGSGIAVRLQEEMYETSKVW